MYICWETPYTQAGTLRQQWALMPFILYANVKCEIVFGKYSLLIYIYIYVLDHAYVIRMQCTCGLKIRNFVPTCTTVPEATCMYLSKHEQTLIVVQNYPLCQIHFEMMQKQISFGWDTMRAIKTRCIVHQQTTMATPDELKNHFFEGQWPHFGLYKASIMENKQTSNKCPKIR